MEQMGVSFQLMWNLPDMNTNEPGSALSEFQRISSSATGLLLETCSDNLVWINDNTHIHAVLVHTVHLFVIKLLLIYSQRHAIFVVVFSPFLYTQHVENVNFQRCVVYEYR